MAKSDESIFSITGILKRFEKVINELLSKLNNENMTPDNFMKLYDALFDFIGFSRKVIFPSITSYIYSDESIRNLIMDDFLEIKKMILNLFNKLEVNLQDIKANIRKEDNKVDLKSVKVYLEFIAKLIDNLAHIIFSTIKYSNNNISEEEYIEDYEIFKETLEDNKRVFRNKFN